MAAESGASHEEVRASGISRYLAGPRSLLGFSLVVLVISCVVVAATLGRAWSWGLFVLVLAAALVGVIAPNTICRIATDGHSRLIFKQAAVETVDPAAPRITVPSTLVTGLAVGLLAASLQAAWLAAAYSILVLLFTVLFPATILLLSKTTGSRDDRPPPL